MSVDVQVPTGAGAPSGPASRPVRVTAVLVVHDGAEWLPRTLAALAGSDRRPDLVVAVDAGSSDRSAVLLDTAVGSTPSHVVDAVVTGSRRDGFGASVARGLAVADSLLAEAAPESDRQDGQGRRDGDDGRGAAPVRRPEEWVWLLHDDSAPEPDALDELLAVVRASPTLAVAGCKQVEWDDPARLLEVGATVSSGGRRITDVTAGDIDQGQHDTRGDVLLVSTAGMLLRRSVLEHVGGFDDAIPLVGDDVDLCMRVRRAGHRVAVVPTAAVRHVAALERGVRPADALHSSLARRTGAPAPRAGGRTGGLESARRRHWLHVRLVQAPALLLPLLWVWVLLAAPVRALVWLLRARPGRALAELDAAVRLVGGSWRVVSSRWRSRRSRVVPASALRPLQRSRGQMLREDLDAWRARRSLGRGDAGQDESSDVPLAALESGPVDEDLIDLDLGAGGPVRRLLAHPLTYLVPLLTLLGALPLVRDVLRPVEVDAAGAEVVLADPTAGLTAVELASRALTGWRDVGLGVVGAADPATAVWATLTGTTSLLTRLSLDGATLGDARGAVVLLGPLLGLLLAYPVLRRLMRSRAAGAAAATTWALLPWTGLLGVLHAGDLVVHVLLPVLLAALAGCLGPRPVRSAAATGLLSAVVVALSPATWPVLVVVAVLVGVVGGSRSLASWRACLPLVGVAAPALVWLAWLPAVRRDARVLLLDPAGVDPTTVALPASGDVFRRAASVDDVLRGDVSLTPDPVPVLALAVLVLLALAVVVGLLLLVAGLARARVPAAWCALLAAAAAAAVGVLAVVVERATGSPASVPVSAAVLALAVVVGLLVRDLHDPDRPDPRHDVRERRVLAAAVRGAAPVVVASLVLGSLAVGLLVDPDRPVAGLPSPALVGAQSPQATRTLLLEAGSGGRQDRDGATAVADDVVSWRVTAGQPGPGQASVASDLARPDEPGRPGERRLADAVASLLGDGSVPGAEVAARLARFGVGWVVVGGSADVDIALAQRAGLVRTSVEDERTTWRVDSTEAGPVPARARLVGPTGEDLGPVDLRGALGSVPTEPVPTPSAGAATDDVGPADRVVVDTTTSSADGDDGAGTVQVPDGGPGRVLVLADNARTGWRATVSGAPLTTTTVDGWAQGFLLPAGAAEVDLAAPMSPPRTTTVSAVVVLVLLALLLWPGSRPNRRLEGGRRLVAPPTRRSTRVRQRVTRTIGAVVAVAVTSGALLLGTGTGSGPGVLQLDRQVRAALAGTGAGQVVGDRVARLVDGLPVDGDPLVTAATVTLAAAGSLSTCAAPGDDDAAGAAAQPSGAGVGAVRGLTSQAETEGDARGLRLSACPTTATSSWTLLRGTGVGQQATLLLANPGETGAVVDVLLGGPDGPVETPSSTGLLVGPGDRTEVRLDALAPDLPAVIARVEARQGTVAVTATDTGLVGLVPQGGDSQPAQVVPAAELVVPGVLVPEDGVAQLLVGAVGEVPAVVGVRAVPVGGGDPVDVTGSELIVAPAGGVVEADLSDLATGTWALHIVADSPVVASATWTSQRDGDPAEGLTGVPVDRAWAQAVPAEPAWTTPVRLPLSALAGRLVAPTYLTLSLVAGGEEAGEARLQVLDADSRELTALPVELPAGGAPVDVALGDLLDGVDAEAVDSLVVRSATGVHIGMRASVTDPDGPLVAATSVPGAPPAPETVRLLRR